MSAVVFLDTETTGLDASVDEVWEIAAQRVNPDGSTEHLHCYVQHDITRATNLPKEFRTDHDARYDASTAVPWPELVPHLEHVFRRARDGGRPHLVGACPWFDAAFITRHMPAPWHYHLIDVEALAVGALATAGTRMPLPYDSDVLTAELGLPPAADRHAAAGDVAWAMAIYDVVLGLHPASDLGAAHRSGKATADQQRWSDQRLALKDALIERDQLRLDLTAAQLDIARLQEQAAPSGSASGEGVSGHTIAWTIEREDILGVVTCHEQPGALCLKQCEAGCWDWRVCDAAAVSQPGRIWCGDCARDFPEGSEHCTDGHELVPRDECSLAEGVDLCGGAEEAYAGPSAPLISGPIAASWDEGNVLWGYPKPVAEVTT